MRICKNVMLIFIIVSFSSFGSLFGQEITKTINLSQDEEIEEVKSDGSNTIVFTYNSSKPVSDAYKICVYSTDGNELFKMTQFDQIPGSVFFDNNQDDVIIIIMNGGAPGLDDIKAINFRTGKEIWTANSNAESYAISPDCTKLLTALPPFDDAPSFQVIDVSTGTVKDINVNNNYYAAEWFNNDRIIFCNRVIVKKVKQTRKEPTNELEQIRAELHELAKLSKENPSKREDYNKEIKRLIEKKRSIISNIPKREDLIKHLPKKDRSELMKKRRAKIADNTLERIFELIVYNLPTESIEKQINLKIDGVELNVPYQGDDIHTITIDKDQNIYISGYLEGRRVLVKYDSNLMLINYFEIEEYSRLTTFSKGDELIFREINRKDEIKILDENAGGFREVLVTDKLPKAIKEVNKRNTHYDISDNYKLINNSKTLLIKKKENE